jgi:hypothetical protein
MFIWRFGAASFLHVPGSNRKLDSAITPEVEMFFDPWSGCL